MKYLDAPSYCNSDPASVLKSAERDKKTKYQAACALQRRTFVPCIASTDGLIGEEFEAVLSTLASALSKKWGRPYPPIKAFVKNRVSLALARGSSLCLRGSRVPSSRIAFRNSLFDDVFGAFQMDSFR